jgi:hypothetical protein
VYAPCCPRGVYSGLVAANRSPDALARMALVATSMASQGASSSMFLALTRTDYGFDAAGGDVRPGSAAGDGGGEGGEEELHARLAARGAVVEALLPDIGRAHGVATSVHLFPRDRLLRAGVL